MKLSTVAVLLVSLMSGCEPNNPQPAIDKASAAKNPGPSYTALIQELSKKHDADASWMRVFQRSGDFGKTFTFEFQEVMDALVGKRMLVVTNVFDIYRHGDGYVVHSENPVDLLVGSASFVPRIALQLAVDRETAMAIAEKIHKHDAEADHYFAFVVIQRRMSLRYDRDHQLDEDGEITSEWMNPPVITIHGECAAYEFVEYDVEDIAIAEM